jgi:hypothetical protein
MKYAIIEDGTVVNIAKADAPLADNWIEAGAAEIGDTWDGETFTTPGPTSEQIAEQQTARRRAMAVERWSFATAAMNAGHITAEEAQAWGPGNALPAAVDAALSAAIEDPGQLAAAKVRALAGPNINRLNPLIEILRGAFGMTEEQADDLFTAAKQIEVAE